MATRHIELGLNKIKQIWSAGPNGPVGRYIERLMDVVGEAGAAPDEQKPGTFKETLTQSRERLFQEVDATEFAREGRAAVLLCEQQFARLRRHHRDREGTLADIIATLTRAMQDVAGQSSAFNASLLVESEKMGRLVQLDDIVELKKQVASSVEALCRAVAEKQRRDEETQATLASQVQSLQSRLVEARNEALIDELTRIGNRRAFDRALNRWFTAAADSPVRPFVVALFDIDNFKQINDTHGHPVGDRVLLAFAQRLTVSVRPIDLVARYGGEEFVVLFGEMTLSMAERRLGEIVQQTAEAVFEYDQDTGKKQLQFTVTCGATEYGKGDSPDEFVKRADEALYEGKRAGKNRVVVKRRSRFASLF